MNKFLLVKTSSLGDIVQTFPVLGYLRQKFPQAQIDWVVETSFSELVQAHPAVDRVICATTHQWKSSLWKNRREIQVFRKELRSEEYDSAFDLQGNIKSGLLLSQVKAKKKVGFGWKTLPEWPNGLFTSQKLNPPAGKNIREDYLYLVQKSFGDDQPYEDSPVVLKISKEEEGILDHLLSKPPRILVSPAAAWPNKMLTFERLVEMLEPLEGSFFFAWGTEKEKELSEKLRDHFSGRGVLLDRLSLPLLQNLMSCMDLVVAMDSLPLHLAGTTRTNTLSFFGPTLASKYIPLGPRHRFTQGSCPYHVQFEKRCPKLRSCSTGKCLKD